MEKRGVTLTRVEGRERVRKEEDNAGHDCGGKNQMRHEKRKRGAEARTGEKKKGEERKKRKSSESG